MNTRRYIFYTLVYLVLIWIFVYIKIDANYSLDLHWYQIDLRIATWFVAPIALFALLSIIHMSYYGLKNFFDARAVKSDLNQYLDLAKETYLGLESNKDFKTDLYSLPGEITRSLSPWKIEIEPKFKNEEIANAYELSKKVLNGEACEIKRYKLSKLNPLFVQNEKNKIDANYTHAISIMSDQSNENQNLKAYAKDAIIKNAKFDEISKINFELTNDDIFILLDRFVSKKLDLESENLYNLINKNEFSSDEYIKIAAKLKKFVNPDQLISVFEQLKNEHFDAMEAFLYLLYDFQMIERLNQIMQSNEDNDFERIKILLFLREHGKRANASLFYK